MSINRRPPSSKGDGSSFSDSEKLQIWQKATVIAGFNPAVWRRDICGHAIKWTDYGNVNSEYGWEIDHIKPVALFGSDHQNNLQALFWRTNRKKGDDPPSKNYCLL